jgi:hypothetical protein
VVTDKQTHFIKLNTDYDGDFKVTILSEDGDVLFCQNMQSYNRQIILRGFSLKQHTVTLSPIKLKI